MNINRKRMFLSLFNRLGTRILFSLIPTKIRLTYRGINEADPADTLNMGLNRSILEKVDLVTLLDSLR